MLDNVNTHPPASFYDHYEPEEAKRIANKLDMQYTPKHGSWLNMAEIEFSTLSRQCLKKRILDQDTLIEEVKAWETRRNEEGVGGNWRFATQEARIKLKLLYPTNKCKN